MQAQFASELNNDKSTKEKELAERCAKQVADLKQMNSLLMNQACQKSAAQREIMQLQEKLTRKKEKQKFTQLELERNIKESDKLRAVVALLAEKIGPSAEELLAKSEISRIS